MKIGNNKVYGNTSGIPIRGYPPLSWVRANVVKGYLNKGLQPSVIQEAEKDESVLGTIFKDEIGATEGTVGK